MPPVCSPRLDGRWKKIAPSGGAGFARAVRAELGILAGKKLGFRKLGMAAGIVDKLIQTME